MNGLKQQEIMLIFAIKVSTRILQSIVSYGKCSRRMLSVKRRKRRRKTGRVKENDLIIPIFINSVTKIKNILIFINRPWIV